MQLPDEINLLIDQSWDREISLDYLSRPSTITKAHKKKAKAEESGQNQTW